MSTQLRFSPSPNTQAAHTVFLGPKALLSPSSLSSQIPSDVSSALTAVHSGNEKVTKAWSGENSFTFAALEEKTSRWMGPIRGDVVQKLVNKHVASKQDGMLLSRRCHIISLTY